MKVRFFVFPAIILLAAASAFPASIPDAAGEAEHYSISWPSGLSLGEAALSGSRSKADSSTDHLSFHFTIDAAIPGFRVADRFESRASGEFCSTEFQKKIQQGNRKADETTTFSPDGTARRQSNVKDGGHTDLETPSCAKDALAYLFYVRKELSEGRLPQEQTIYFGAPYKVRLEFGGTQQIQLGDKNVDADKLLATVQGEASNVQFEIYFLKDAARTLAMVKVPLSMGTFAMTLER